MKNLVKKLKITLSSWKKLKKTPEVIIWKDWGNTRICNLEKFQLIIEDEVKNNDVLYKGTLILKPMDPQNSFKFERDYDTLDEAKKDLLFLARIYKNKFKDL